MINAGRLDVIDEIYAPQMTRAARRWTEPLSRRVADVRMHNDDLIAEGEKVVGRLHCPATNLDPWRGNPPTGHFLERVDEVYISRVVDGRITKAWGLETTRERERQLGLLHHEAAGRRARALPHLFRANREYELALGESRPTAEQGPARSWC